MSNTSEALLTTKAIWSTISTTAVIVSAVWFFFFHKMMSLKNEQIILLKEKASPQTATIKKELLSSEAKQTTIKALRNIQGVKGTIQVQAGNPLGEQLAQQFRSVFEDAKWEVSYEKSNPVNTFANLLVTIPESNTEIQGIMEKLITDLGYPDALKTTNVKVVNILIGQGFK